MIAATLKSVGGYSMGLMVPVLAAFIAQSISGRPGMLAGLVGGMIASETGSGFIGGILAGFLAGYVVEGFVKLLKGMPRQLEGLKSIFVVPIVTVGIVGIAMVLIGGPCSALNQAMMDFLAGLQNTSPIVLGIVVGCMSAFDMGGPVNKAAYVTGTMLLAQGNYYFMAGVSAACITPPLVINVKAAAARASVPIAMHLDHGSGFGLAMQALREGYTSIMIDGSHESFEGNITVTRAVVDACSPSGIPVEAELGKVGGKEDDLDGGEGNGLPDPLEAREFVERTGVSSLAIAIGTAHGIYKGGRNWIRSGFPRSARWWMSRWYCTERPASRMRRYRRPSVMESVR